MKKANQPKPQVKTGAAKQAPKQKLSQRGRIICLCVLVAVILGALVGGFFGIRAALGYGRDFNYMNKDLSKYVKLSAEDVKNIVMTVAVDKPTEEDVEREIVALLVEHKTLDTENIDPDAVIANGSVVSIYYSGYLLSEDGDREYFSGGSNLSGNISSLIIGSATFMPGFEKGLIGIRPSDTEMPTVIKEGKLSEGDVVYANIEGFHPEGKNLRLYGQRLELTPALDDVYGKGFYDLLVGSEIGENLCSSLTTLESTKAGEGTFVYKNLRTLYKTEGGKAHTVESYFPLNYQEASLQGKTAYFDVYIQDTTSYKVPEYTDAFLTETVGIISEKLDAYEGSTLTEKYRSYVREVLDEDYEERLLEATEKTFWEKIAEVAEVKSVPRSAWLEIYDGYIEDLETTYSDYLTSSGYTAAVYPFETFCKDYCRLEDGESYKTYVKNLSKQTAGEKIIFFYAIQLLEVAPSESELAKAYDETLTELAKQYSSLDESYYESQPDEEAKKKAYQEYITAIEDMKQDVKTALGEEYLLESAYYNYSFPKLLDLTKISYIGKGHE